MGNLFSTLNISASAIRVHQSAISIVSNNIANMNTEGCSKQRANLGTNLTGVEMINVGRYTTTFEKSYYFDQITEQAYLNKQAETASNTAGMFDELKGSGLNGALEGFYETLDNLSQNPSDSSAKINFADAASYLSDSVNNVSSKLHKLKSEQNSQLNTSIDSLNEGLKELAGINKMLAMSRSGTLENNNLLDKRDSVLKELSKYGNFETDIFSNGSVNLSIDGTKLVRGVNVVKTIDEKDLKKFDSGLIKGTLDGISDIDSVINDINSFAQSIADEFNNLHTREGAYYIDNDKLSNENLTEMFNYNDGKLSIHPDFSYDKISTAYFANPADFDINAVGNANNVSRMKDTQDKITNSYDSILSKVTSKAASKINASNSQDSFVNSLDTKIKEQTGIDLNEELADLVRYQTAIEASSRVFAVCNSVLDTLVHLGE